MIEYVDTINRLLAVGTVLLQLVTAVGFGLLFVPKERLVQIVPAALLSQFALPLAFVLALSGVSMTLFYSEIVGYTPCSLCWFQRIFLYPQVLILGMALYKRDRGVVDYLIALSIIGAVVALYQYYIQLGGFAGVGCPSSGELVSCSKRYIYEFNYITFPLMSFSLFAFLAVLLGHFKKIGGHKDDIDTNTLNSVRP